MLVPAVLSVLLLVSSAFAYESLNDVLNFGAESGSLAGWTTPTTNWLSSTIDSKCGARNFKLHSDTTVDATLSQTLTVPSPLPLAAKVYGWYKGSNARVQLIPTKDDFTSRGTAVDSDALGPLVDSSSAWASFEYTLPDFVTNGAPVTNVIVRIGCKTSQSCSGLRFDNIRVTYTYLDTTTVPGSPFSCADHNVNCDTGWGDGQGGSMANCNVCFDCNDCGECLCPALTDSDCAGKCGKLINPCNTLDTRVCTGVAGSNSCDGADESCTSSNTCQCNEHVCTAKDCDSFTNACPNSGGNTVTECGTTNCNSGELCVSNTCTCPNLVCDPGQCGTRTNGCRTVNCLNPCDGADESCDDPTNVCQCNEHVCAATDCDAFTNECPNSGGNTVTECGTTNCKNGELCVSNTCTCPAIDCTGKCGVVTNTCNNMLDCGTSNCGTYQTCDSLTNQCLCDTTKCLASDDRSCVSNTCRCDPIPVEECTGKCGIIKNKCLRSRDCGSCGEDRYCNSTANLCECNALQCSLSDCGEISNNCSTKACAQCIGNDDCIDNVCVCQPGTCQTLGKACGNHSDGCRGLIECGICANNLACDPDGNCFDPNCTPTTSCLAEGRTCGFVWTGCVNSTCGLCPGTQVCNGNGTSCACPDVDVRTFCLDQGFECGTTFDGCKNVNCPQVCPPGVSCESNKCTSGSPPPLSPNSPPAADLSAAKSSEDGGGGLWWIGIVAGVLCILFVVAAVAVYRRSQQDDGVDNIGMQEDGRTAPDNENVFIYGAVPAEEEDGGVEVYGSVPIDDGAETPVVYASLGRFQDGGDETPVVYASLGQFQDDDSNEQDGEGGVVYATLSDFRS